jgi:hypothetical protein
LWCEVDSERFKIVSAKLVTHRPHSIKRVDEAQFAESPDR